jgi:hypothetical protein
MYNLNVCYNRTLLTVVDLKHKCDFSRYEETKRHPIFNRQCNRAAIDTKASVGISALNFAGKKKSGYNSRAFNRHDVNNQRNSNFTSSICGYNTYGFKQRLISRSHSRWPIHWVNVLSPRPFEMFRNNVSFDGEELLAPRPNSKFENKHLSSVRACFFNTFAAILCVWWPDEAPFRDDRVPPTAGGHLWKW